MSARSDLIDLYANHDASSAKSTPRYEELRTLYLEDAQFPWLRDQIEEIKNRIEQRIGTAASQQAQLREAIRMLREYRKHEDKRELFYELVVAMFVGKWELARMGYLEKA